MPAFTVQKTKFSTLPTPKQLHNALPTPLAAQKTLLSARKTLHDILNNQDPRFLIIIGPCSIHNTDAALEYARKLQALSKRYSKYFYIVMRTYLEKPRTHNGWKGLLNDPHLNETYDITQGLVQSRELLIKINALGLPVANEFLNPITPLYIEDLVSWAAIGARTTESPIHRQLSSTLPMPVGFKNTPSGNITAALDAICIAQQPNHFLGMQREGTVTIQHSTGNPYAHLVLRGAHNQTNYTADTIKTTAKAMLARGLQQNIIIDCSHGNSQKIYRNQIPIAKEICLQKAYHPAIKGLMLESNLLPGKQSLQAGIPPTPGQSITDPCLGWEETEKLLKNLYTVIKR